jgi:hypothetical protein
MDVALDAVFTVPSTGGNTPRAGSPSGDAINTGRPDSDSETSAKVHATGSVDVDSRASSSTLRPDAANPEDKNDIEQEGGGGSPAMDGKMTASTSSLEQEVGQVMSGLSSWWGGLRKQVSRKATSTSHG